MKLRDLWTMRQMNIHKLWEYSSRKSDAKPLEWNLGQTNPGGICDALYMYGTWLKSCRFRLHHG